MRALACAPLLALALTACRAQPAEPAEQATVPTEQAAPQTPETGIAEVTEPADSPDTGVNALAAEDSGVPGRVTNVPQLQLTTLNGSGAGIAPLTVQPGRELRLQRVTPSQNELRLRTNIPNQVRQPVRQGLPSTARPINSTPTTTTSP